MNSGVFGLLYTMLLLFFFSACVFVPILFYFLFLPFVAFNYHFMTSFSLLPLKINFSFQNCFYYFAKSSQCAFAVSKYPLQILGGAYLPSLVLHMIIIIRFTCTYVLITACVVAIAFI